MITAQHPAARLATNRSAPSDVGRRAARFLAVLVGALVPTLVAAQPRPDPAAALAAQRKAMAKLELLDGAWRGNAWTATPSGERHNLTQTERVGPLLGGSIRVIEGRGYEADGSLGFNAFAVVSYDPGSDSYTLRSYAQGRTGDFTLTPTDNGIVWEIPAGPATVRHTVTIENGTWREVGDLLVPGRDPVRILEMSLVRVGDTDWPAAGALGPDRDSQ